MTSAPDPRPPFRPIRTLLIANRGEIARRILRTAQLYLLRHPELACLPCRFDVIAFEPRQSGNSLRIRWIPGAFTA